MSNFPASLPVKVLDAQADEYTDNIDAWNEIDILYRGGPAIKKLVGDFLMRRQKELGDVYTERSKMFDYPNVFKQIVGYFRSALFEDDPDIQIKRNEEAIAANNPFWSRWIQNCNRNGKTYVDFWRGVYLSAIQYRTGWVLIDLPKVDQQFENREQQRLSGALDPYLVLYTPRQVINWDVDDAGALLWVCVKGSYCIREFAKPNREFDRWYYFDRTTYATYESERKDGQPGSTGNLIAGPAPHALADQNVVPFIRVEYDDDLWLGSSLYQRAKKHLNLHNAQDWGMYVACLPLLYIIGEYKEPPNSAPTSWLNLPAGSTIGYVEPTGKTYELTMQRIQELVEEMYREAGLHDQGKAASASRSAQSGYSKRMDAEPSRVLLNAYGDVIRAQMQNTLNLVGKIVDPELTFDVIGFDFDDDNEGSEAETDQAVLDLTTQMGSPTLEREVKKRIALKSLKDANKKLTDAVCEEIDKAPVQSEVDAVNAAAQDKANEQRIKDSLKVFE